MIFEVISNESILERKIEAGNWLEIVRYLHTGKNFNTQNEELSILEKVYANGKCSFYDFIDLGARNRTFVNEIAVFRLLHRGKLTSNLDVKALDYNTELSL